MMVTQRLNRSILSWPLFLACLSIAFGCLQGSTLLLDSDTLWHIRTGEWIWLHKRPPLTDTFSHTFYGQPWLSHEWLASLMLYGVHTSLSWPGLVAMACLAFGSTVGVIARFLFDRLEPVRALLVVALVMFSLSTHLLARPHVLAMPLLATWAVQCVVAVEHKRRPPIWLAAVMMVWANIHGSFIVGLFLVAAFALDATLTSPANRRAELARQWAVFGCVTLAAAILTPHHVYGLLFPFQLKSMDFMVSVISEWRSPNFQQFEAQEAWIFGLLVLCWLLKVRLSWVRIALLLLLMHLSLAHTRHLTLLAIVAPLMLATPFREALDRVSAPEPNAFDRLLKRGQGLPYPMLSMVYAPVTAWLFLALQGKPIVPPKSTLPTEALEFLRQNPQQGNVLNAYGFGGALIFERIPVFIDGRAELYGDAFLHTDYEALRGTPKKLPNLLDCYNVNWTFLDARSTAVQILDLLPEWVRIYSDEQIVIHSQRRLHTGN